MKFPRIPSPFVWLIEELVDFAVKRLKLEVEVRVYNRQGTGWRWHATPVTPEPTREKSWPHCGKRQCRFVNFKERDQRTDPCEHVLSRRRW